jgi:hypothetical protein
VDGRTSGLTKYGWNDSCESEEHNRYLR